MKYLADENVARRIVAWLRGRGDDVLYAAEESAGEMDSAWLRQAEAEGRIICHFGQGLWGLDLSKRSDVSWRRLDPP